MSKNVIAILSLTLFLAGCAGMQAREEKTAAYQSCDQHKSFIASAACTKRIAATDTALLPGSPDMQELVALKAVLAEKVRAKKMTNAEAWLKYITRKNELARQAAQARAERNAAIRASMYRNSQRTTCTGLGNQIDCNTY